MKPRVLLPLALGTNRDNDLAQAFAMAGAEPVIVPLSQLRAGDVSMADFQMLAIPGGFSYGDALGAGRLLGLDLAGWFGEQLQEAVAAQKPIFGVCNGFQALVRAGLLPGSDNPAALSDSPPVLNPAVLGENASGRFECRWVTLAAPSSRSVWTSGLSESLRCPVAHGEGRFIADDVAALEASSQIALRYVQPDGSEAAGAYPSNPNGSVGDIAGVCDSSGLVLGMMPHPENHVLARQDPQRGRKPPAAGSGLCLELFASGVAAVSG